MLGICCHEQGDARSRKVVNHVMVMMTDMDMAHIGDVY
jgi:hypothetical protein